VRIRDQRLVERSAIEADAGFLQSEKARFFCHPVGAQMQQVLIFDTTLRAGEQSPGQSPGARLTRATEDGIERAGRQPELQHD
jgi:hypothetical protein